MAPVARKVRGASQGVTHASLETRAVNVGLKTYHAKRSFDRTPEPRGAEREARGPLRFVVQKHHASRLHYDFRLELDGALKSWAVPKGPSLNPRDRRLAVMVEDHPLDYATFEGTIPEGNYGAGSVIVWDTGTYHAPKADGRVAGERRLSEGLAKGHLRFVLEGQKLRGGFSLVRLKRGDGNSWLLIKADDTFATTDDVTAQDRSVISRRTVDELERNAARSPGRGRTRGTSVAAGRAKASMPLGVRPMLATLVDRPFDRAGWLFEPKWDGYRAIAEVSASGVVVYSRNGKPLDSRFPSIAAALRSLGHEAVLDGEIVAVDEQGRSRFQLLQNYQRTGRGQLLYYVFDALYVDGRDLRALPLCERKQALTTVLSADGPVRLSEHVEGAGTAFFKAASALGLEGIIAKDGDSAYREGARGNDWLKIKTRLRQEAVIAGFTAPRGGRTHLDALILGVYEGGALTYIGHTGGGLDEIERAELLRRLRPFVRHTAPFRDPPRPNAPVRWVEPRLVCEVQFQEWTDSGIARQPIFLGLREDKPALEVRREVPVAASAVASPARKRSRRKAPEPAPNGRAGNAASADLTQRVVLTNRDKVYWPDEGYTKGDLLAYYRDIAPLILPYLRDRPESLHRHPNGIAGNDFFQKDVSGSTLPNWLDTVTVPRESGGGSTQYLLCQDVETLLYIVNLGCIELNPWNSRVPSLANPDYLIIDLDPEGIGFGEVVRAALEVRRVLEQVGADSLCKTSGKTGLHIVVPLGARYGHEQARLFAEIIARMVQGTLPDTTSTVRSPAQRQGRVYLDYLQNRQGQTLAAPYCVRPAPGAPVSTPLRWSEVTSRLDPAKFHLRTIARRVEKLGDLWRPVLGPGVDLAACLERLTANQGQPSMERGRRRGRSRQSVH